MSTATAAVLAPRPAPSRRSPTRPLRAVVAPARRRRPRLAYAIVALAGALAIAAGQMGLSIATTQASYELAQLGQDKRELTWKKQELYDAVAGLSSPQYLAANAAALGMVINASPTYLRLSDGAIIGTSEAAASTSTVDAVGRGAVANSLVADTPLITLPDATIQGLPVEAQVLTDGTIPPPLAEGLPTPTTR
ncbi:MAG TPA: hypothetical protein VNT50_11685 [Microbacterium sp.]|uniref:hypothetical protein n=1 Tax=Microbacterium sp. TaxID=51671 RepID=UPI002B664531|nr:hypothetical protein [Microbacterium sp.]HWI32144.1 hypothetical protein [Microbacterium sp.]